MAGFRKILLLKCFLSLFDLFFCEKQPDALNVLSILLPYSTAGSANVNFTVWAQSGCYKWSSSRPKIAEIRPVIGISPKKSQNDCSQKAIVTSQSSKPEKQTAIIVAEEKGFNGAAVSLLKA
ncbi:nuclear pore membrane glycoprotein 210-like [Xenia sp. Carnegie-2017]|uniref:nuclear pore membrane glycoprotein 210-like n=1 Tax=Xenia sp. Carnegie-2017 TaxID=2897299 RepID=UPI001F041470|nr:nuclear pore membrane glycoprotein 210-like [Xenia sp. Carnegie-2017]